VETELIALVEMSCRKKVLRRRVSAPSIGHCDRDSLTIPQRLRQQFAATALSFAH
jgi:hypothetical protein